MGPYKNSASAQPKTNILQLILGKKEREREMGEIEREGE